MPISRTAFCLFCDDVRMEVGNKPSYMGVYAGGELQFPADLPADLPILLPKFAIVIWILSAVDDTPQRLTVRVYTPPGRTEIIQFEAPLDATPYAQVYPDSDRVSLNLTLPITNLQLACEGSLEVAIETEREVLRAGRLRIRMPGRPDPTASPTTENPAGAPTPPPPPQDSSANTTPERRRRRAKP
jgi:hypothetical protein